MKSIRFLLFILSLTGFIEAITFESAQRYAASMPESPEPVGPSYLLNPDYSLWHRQHRPSRMRRFFEMIGLSQPDWAPKEFKELIRQVTDERIKAGYDHLHDLTIIPYPESQFIIFGPLLGSYHSLVRSLGELIKQELIDNELRLLKPNTFLVIDGNVINGSPYNMETLSLALALMKANPSQVVYIAGAQEIDDTWLGYGLKKELTERAGDTTFEPVVSQFFSTLPRALFIKSPVSNEGIIKIGTAPSRGLCTPSSKKERLGVLKICSHTTAEPAEKSLDVRAVIAGETRLMSYKQHAGLAQAPSKDGALTWAVFSAPNTLYRDHFYFTYDAFVILTTGKTLAQSVLTLVNQDVREQSGFTKVARYGVMTGKNLVPKPLEIDPRENRFIPSKDLQKRLTECKDASESTFGSKEIQEDKKEPIVIGCTIDLTKGASPLGKRVRDGIALRMNKLNAEGGINGRPVKMVFMDDEYSPEKARQNVENFIKTYNSKLFLCSLGSPTLEAYVDLVKEEKIFLFFPITGAPMFRTPEMKGVVHWRASYKTEAKVLTQYMTDHFRIANFAFLYQNDAYGLGALEGSNEVIKKEGIKNFVNVRYERNTTTFVDQINQVRDAAATGLGFFSTSLAATEFIRQAGVDFFIGKKLFALSDLAEESFKKFVQLRGLDMVIAQFAPNPQTSQMPLVKEFRKVLMQQGDPSADVFTLEGYISASLAIYILERAKDFESDTINKVIESIKAADYKGLPLSFDSKTRELVQELWIDTGAPEWIQQRMRS